MSDSMFWFLVGCGVISVPLCLIQAGRCYERRKHKKMPVSHKPPIEPKPTEPVVKKPEVEPVQESLFEKEEGWWPDKEAVDKIITEDCEKVKTLEFTRRRLKRKKLKTITGLDWSVGNICRYRKEVLGLKRCPVSKPSKPRKYGEEHGKAKGVLWYWDKNGELKNPVWKASRNKMSKVTGDVARAICKVCAGEQEATKSGNRYRNCDNPPEEKQPEKEWGDYVVKERRGGKVFTLIAEELNNQRAMGRRNWNWENTRNLYMATLERGPENER